MYGRRRIDIGAILAAAGALLLLVSLFLDWYEEDRDGWKVFEALDLVLAATALLVLAGAAARLGVRQVGPAERAMLPAAVTALVIVLSQLVNHPPAAVDVGNDTGIYLAIAGAALMTAGTVAGMARIWLAVEVDRGEGVPVDSAPAAPSAAAEPAAPPPSPEAETTRMPPPPPPPQGPA
jgi:hypothetical protein